MLPSRKLCFFPYALGCMESHSRHTQTHSPLKAPELPTESRSVFLFEFIFFWQKGAAYFQEVEPGEFAEPALWLWHILLSCPPTMLCLHSSCFSGALRSTTSGCHCRIQLPSLKLLCIGHSRCPLGHCQGSGCDFCYPLF